MHCMYPHLSSGSPPQPTAFIDPSASQVCMLAVGWCQTDCHGEPQLKTWIFRATSGRPGSCLSCSLTPCPLTGAYSYLRKNKLFTLLLKQTCSSPVKPMAKALMACIAKKRNVNGSVLHPMQCIPCCARHAIRTDIHLRNQDNAMQEP